MDNPLDRPIWTALTTRQSPLAEAAGGIRRFPAAYGAFAASAEGTTDSLASLGALVPPGGQVYLLGSAPVAPPPGFVAVRTLDLVQMVAERVDAPPADFAVDELAAADGPEMLALARLTKPGPFATRTHELGRFVGIRQAGRLVAMAGERMKPGPFTEISGVCTHPDHRGQGYAAKLMQEIARTIQQRGETAFLHVMAENAGAISVYRRLGFVIRWQPTLMVWQREPA